ncbi:amino acid ABC transporter substrate-binding protein, partial [Mycolicibacterium sphagni]|nr:amino acid ABC transporter substrate-binding protein [Mycolicibacterium sphagni]
MKNRTLARVFAVAGVAALALTACSAEESDDTAATGDDTATATETEAEVASTEC